MRDRRSRLQQARDSLNSVVISIGKRKKGLTVLLVEQKLPFARRVAIEFCILDKGRQVAGGPISELSDQFVRAHLSV